ncbi:hypothetical protein [Nostoc sp. CCY 9925]|uniref:hypothetical protein n=1 Tax=Nostoc sp. CCY 9925 TaxID=3103865 RepID=UPI0039C631E5
MNAEDFESDFVDFYVDFGYRADGILPDGINPASHLESEAGLDSLAAMRNTRIIQNLRAVTSNSINSWFAFLQPL